jgi:hypothetical protein
VIAKVHIEEKGWQLKVKEKFLEYKSKRQRLKMREKD